MSGDDGTQTTQLSYNMKNKIKKLPTETRILFQQTNPKRPGSESHTRYEKYKSASNVGEFIDHGGKRADLLYDYSKGYMTVPHLEALSHIVAPTLALAATANIDLLLPGHDHPLRERLRRADRLHDILSATIDPSITTHTSASLSAPWDTPSEGSQPSHGTTHDTWAHAKLSDSTEEPTSS